ncbi:mycothiol synthase [Curtobacterium sp. SL109]|uniref:mycothiol synthase n=1 Tax=Curtobacterium sp. SL109 TaxID=2994662 RepID=UPI002276BB08|nr:mycothiol synthase [Curtobacterium sp. SL109]MCY1693165.1 mycothiol synthase [Curtobacterium sp. SL109]
MPDLGAFVVPGEPPPFSDQTLVDVRAGRAVVLEEPDGVPAGPDGVAAGLDGVAVVRDGELELVVRREARGHGTGTRLVERALALGGGAAPRLAWAHGDSPAARAIATRYGWAPTRTLLQLRAPVPTTGAELGLPTGSTLAAFRPGTDEADWLALNAAAFASHPEQGSMTMDDLLAREAEPWFDAADLVLLRDASGALAGSCWLKVEDGIGEFYAVAVRPDLQGQGLGGVLMRAGTARLVGRGLAAQALYVEGDNEPALALYRRSGFTQHAIDVQYAAPA